MAKTLLLADDSVTIQKVVGISFASEDVTLVTVDNGDDALIKAREVSPDLILADVVMPGKTGYEVCEGIKADPALRHIPVLLLTGTFEAFDEERAQAAGAAGHVSKPFEAQTLVARVKELLANPPAPTAAPAAPAEPVVQPPVAQPAAPAAAAAPDAATDPMGDAFDFFDEEPSDASATASMPAEPTPVVAPAPPPAATPVTPPVAGDDDFAFGDDLATPEPGSPMAGIPEAEHTIAMPDIPTMSGGVAPDSTVAILSDAPGAQPSDSAPDMTLIANLDDIPVSPAAAPADDLLSLDTPSSGAVAVDVADDLTEDPFEFAFDPSSSAGPGMATGISSPTAEATVLDPGVAAGYDVSSSDLGDSLVGAAASPEPMAPPPPTPQVAPAPPQATAASAPAATPGPGVADAALAAIAPRLREELHTTLEKIAWESFGDVTDKIVRMAVDRIEKIAWEVIPTLAESLVREEIQRMKGDPPGE